MRKTIIILVSCTVVLLLGYSGYRGYELWKQNHWLSLAKQFAAKHDTHNEFLCLEQALQFNSRNVEACRMMANLADLARSPGALAWRKKVLDLDPDSFDDRLALAQTAIMSHDFATARNALAGADAGSKNTAPYFNVAGELALATDQPDEAESDFAQAARMDPSNPSPQLSLAVIELHRTNSLDAAEARITLKRLSMNPTNVLVASQAKRELILDALRFRDRNTAISLSSELARETNAMFSDKLLYLDALRTAQSEEYRAYLAQVERAAATHSDELSQLTLWFVERNLPDQALNWLQSLPAGTQTNMPAALFAAQCQMLLHDWSGLQTSLSKENWGRIDMTRHAFIARALREQGLYEASKAEWDVALTDAKGGDQALTDLCRLAAQWRWQNEAQQILWSIVNNYPQEHWATEALSVALLSNGSTRPLMQLFSLEVNRNPNDLDAKNNLALTAMLLRAQELNPYQITREVYDTAPTNSFYACTYAFSLYLQGKNAAALKIMQHITPQALKNDSTAGYYGLILKAAGDNAKADAYLKRAVRGQLLPEERALFQQAMLGR